MQFFKQKTGKVASAQRSPENKYKILSLPTIYETGEMLKTRSDSLLMSYSDVIHIILYTIAETNF